MENALGQFLRARRESVTPGMVGLPSGGRRRTPGLRRTELADLAGISVEYLTRLERGSDRHPSAQVLGALADALVLSLEERVHLHRLSKVTTRESCAQSAQQTQQVRPTVLKLLEALEPAPAAVLDGSRTILATTAGFRALAGPTGLLDEAQPNLPWFVFTDERARTTFPDWEQVADEHAAALRTAADLCDQGAAVLAEELCVAGGTAFSRRYLDAPSLPASTGTETWKHPEIGTVRLAYETLPVPGTDEQRLLTYLPADPAAESALADLTLASRVG